MEETAVLEPTEADEFATDQAAMEQPAELPPEPAADEPDYVREHYDAILEKERSVRILENDYLEAMDQASEAKKAFDRADKALRDLISRGPDPQRSLPFDEPAPEAWRAAPLSELNLPDGLHNLLIAASVETIGQLEDLRAKVAERKGEWPKGIGEARITELENKVIDWLTSNRDKFGEAAEGATTTTIIAPDDAGTDDYEQSQESFKAEVAETFDELGILAKPAHKSNGKAKAKKRGFAGRPAKKSKAKKGRR